MRRHSISNILVFGENLRYISYVDTDYPITLEPPEKGKVGVLGVLDHFLETLEQFELRVTLRAAQNLSHFRDTLKAAAPGQHLSQTQAKELCALMETLKHTLFAEAADRHVFFVPNRRFNLDWLLKNPVKLLPAGVFDALPDIAKYDLAEAGKCIAYSIPTGAAFHILRATEAVLCEYYCRIIQRNRVTPLTWGAITADFKKHRTKPSAQILENLDYIRRNFRNPTAHPESRFDLEEAQRLFQLCIDAISRIISDPLWTKSTAPRT